MWFMSRHQIAGARCAVTDGENWYDEELAGSRFLDARLGQRLRTLMLQLAGAVGAPIPLACQDWANTKAAYRFLSNDSVSEELILAGHFQATAQRAAATEGLLLVLQDTTEFVYQRAAVSSPAPTSPRAFAR